MESEAEWELERCRNVLVDYLPLDTATDMVSESALRAVCAVIVQAKRVGAEERDRQLLAKMVTLTSIDGGLFDVIGPGHMGYEPDGSGGWRKGYPERSERIGDEAAHRP